MFSLSSRAVTRRRQNEKVVRELVLCVEARSIELKKDQSKCKYAYNHEDFTEQ